MSFAPSRSLVFSIVPERRRSRMEIFAAVRALKLLIGRRRGRTSVDAADQLSSAAYVRDGRFAADEYRAVSYERMRNGQRFFTIVAGA